MQNRVKTIIHVETAFAEITEFVLELTVREQNELMRELKKVIYQKKYWEEDNK